MSTITCNICLEDGVSDILSTKIRGKFNIERWIKVCRVCSRRLTIILLAGEAVFGSDEKLVQKP